MIHSCDDSQIMQALRKANAPESAFRTVYKDGIDIDRPAHWVTELIEILTAKPTQAVKTFWASENILKEYLRDNISCVLTTTKCAANTVPLYTVPPAIDETRHRLILVCEYLETVGLMFVSPRVISSQIRAILEETK